MYRKIKFIVFYGFKNRNVGIEFNDSRINVLYGKNGVGKTSILESINAIFNRDENILLGNNINEILLIIEEDGNLKKIEISKKEVSQFMSIEKRMLSRESRYDWTELDESRFSMFSTIFISTQRGLKNYRDLFELSDLVQYLRVNSNVIISAESSVGDLLNFIDYINHDNQGLINFDDNKNLNINTIRMKDIKELLLDNQRKKFDEIHESNKKVEKEIAKSIMNFLVKDIKMFDKIDDYIEVKDNYLKLETFELQFLSTIIDKSVMSLIKNIFERYDRYEPLKRYEYKFIKDLKHYLKEYKEVNTIQCIKFFEKMTAKEVIIDESSEKISIRVKNQSRFIQHSLEDLSHGERHLLSLLVLLELIGSERDLILIDEPEIALDTDWQKNIIFVIEAITNSQVLMAAHSPSITQNYMKNQINLLED